MATLQLDDTDLWYEEIGAGPTTCIALHGGLGLDHTYLRPAWDNLAERTRLVYFDMRGNGRSGRPPLATITMARLADDVDALRSHLGVDRVGLAGHSYGGFVALEYALRHPDALAFLLLVDTAAGQAPAALAEADVTEPTTTDEEFKQELTDTLSFYFHSFTPEIAEPLLGRTILNGQVGTWSMQQLASWGVHDLLPTIATPTLVAVGRHDKVCPLAASEQIASGIPDAELAVFDNSGHFPWVEEPDVYNATVMEWLSRVATD
jgi:proline iminopeptidase